MFVVEPVWQQLLDQNGFVPLRAIFSTGQTNGIRDGLTHALEQDRAGRAMRNEDGSIFGARNVLYLWPAAVDVGKQPPLPGILTAVVGPGFGLVRGLYFDKPPTRSWALPWHRDLTIAVRDNQRPSTVFRKPTAKAGVPHVEAPPSVLERMLTVRLHLDDVTDENGPLQVIPGSHRRTTEGAPGETILAWAGDVLLMRPLVSHCSGESRPGTARHRRVLHLEFAAADELPDGYTWHDFIPLV